MKQCEVLELLRDIRSSGDNKYYTRPEIIDILSKAGIDLPFQTTYRIIYQLAKDNFLEYDMKFLGFKPPVVSFRARKHNKKTFCHGKTLTINTDNQYQQQKKNTKEDYNA